MVVPARRRAAAGVFGAALGTVAAVAALAATSGAGVRSTGGGPASVEATHLPPLLTASGEPVTLRYDIYCVGADVGATCDAGGTVYARAGDSGPFQALRLRPDLGAQEGRYAARVPDSLVRSGFTYYAVLRDEGAAAATTLPPGAPEALERSLPLGSPAVVALGRHVFGAARPPNARVASAAWGDGPGEVGLEDQGPDATPIGASSFDVDSAGNVTVLDEAHRRLLRWAPRAVRPDAIPVDVHGTIADVEVADDGTTYVFEPRSSGSAVLRTFDRKGRESAQASLGVDADAVGAGPNGPVLLEPQTGRWLPPGRPDAAAVGRPSPGGGRVVVVEPSPYEVRVAVTTAGGSVLRSWRVRSETPLAEVQLAEQVGATVVAVVRAYEERRAEFVVLVLDRGPARQFSVEARDYAETAPLAHFRLSGSALYRLGSSPSGVFVDRYDLGVS